MRKTFKLNKWFSFSIAIIFICLCFVIVLSQFTNKNPGYETIVTQAQLLTEKITLKGSLAPLKQQHVIAPFDGIIIKKIVSRGDVVNQGDEMVIFDSFALKSKIREAEVNVIKAQKKVSKIENWQNSSEVNSVKRSLASTRQDFILQKEKVEKTQNLLDIGVVSENEHKEELARLEQLKIELLSNQESLVNVLQQGSTDELKVVQLERDNALSELEQLRQQFLKRKVNANFDGTIIFDGEVRRNKQQTGKVLFDGDVVKENQKVLTLANKESFMVIGIVDEIHLKSLQIGGRADISVEGNNEIQLVGQLIDTGFEAEPSFDINSRPKFSFTIKVDKVPDDYLSSLRFGMSVNIDFEKYKNASAIVIPHSAVVSGDEGTFVYLVDAKGTKEKRMIEIGVSAFDGVEVLSGLKENEEVIIFQGNNY